MDVVEDIWDNYADIDDEMLASVQEIENRESR
jgi:hypothetical protein